MKYLENLSDTFLLSTLSIGLPCSNCCWLKVPIISFCLLNQCWRDRIVIDFTIVVKNKACMDNGWEVVEIDVNVTTEASKSTF